MSGSIPHNELLTPLLSGLFALGGVVAGGLFQFLLAERSATRQTKERREEAAAKAALEISAAATSRAFPAMLVARHLEAYALECANTVAENSSDYGGYEGFPTFKQWPLIDWQALGASLSVEAQDFEARVALHQLWVDGNIEFGASDERDAARYYAQTSARAGWEAWQIAERTRVEAGLPAFVFGENVWSYPETFKDFLDREEKRKLASERDLDLD
jgi:hypothetical protein